MARAQDQASTTGFNTMDCVTGDILENARHQGLHKVAHQSLDVGAVLITSCSLAILIREAVPVSCTT